MYVGILIICVTVAISIRNAVVHHKKAVVGCLSGLFIGLTITVCVSSAFWIVGSYVFRASFTDTVELDSYDGNYIQLEPNIIVHDFSSRSLDDAYTWYEKNGKDAIEHAYKQNLTMFNSPSDSYESVDDVYNTACKTNTSIVYTNDEPHCEISYSHAIAPEWYKFFSCFKVDDTYEDIHFTFYLPKK